MIRTLDLTKREKGCARGPVARLVRALGEINQGERLRAVFRESDVPARALKAIALSRGFEVSVSEVGGGVYEAILTRVVGSSDESEGGRCRGWM